MAAPACARHRGLATWRLQRRRRRQRSDNQPAGPVSLACAPAGQRAGRGRPRERAGFSHRHVRGLVGQQFGACSGGGGKQRRPRCDANQPAPAHCQARICGGRGCSGQPRERAGFSYQRAAAPRGLAVRRSQRRRRRRHAGGDVMAAPGPSPLLARICGRRECSGAAVGVRRGGAAWLWAGGRRMFMPLAAATAVGSSCVALAPGAPSAPGAVYSLPITFCCLVSPTDPLCSPATYRVQTLLPFASTRATPRRLWFCRVRPAPACRALAPPAAAAPSLPLACPSCFPVAAAALPLPLACTLLVTVAPPAAVPLPPSSPPLPRGGGSPPAAARLHPPGDWAPPAAVPLPPQLSPAPPWQRSAAALPYFPQALPAALPLVAAFSSPPLPRLPPRFRDFRAESAPHRCSHTPGARAARGAAPVCDASRRTFLHSLPHQWDAHEEGFLPVHCMAVCLLPLTADTPPPFGCVQSIGASYTCI